MNVYTFRVVGDLSLLNGAPTNLITGEHGVYDIGGFQPATDEEGYLMFMGDLEIQETVAKDLFVYAAETYTVCGMKIVAKVAYPWPQQHKPNADAIDDVVRVVLAGLAKKEGLVLPEYTGTVQ